MDSYYFIETSASGSVNWPAWTAALIALLVFLSNIYWNRRREWRTYRDTYWFEKIVAPHCVDPIIDYFQEIESAIKQLDTPAGRDQRKHLRYFDATVHQKSAQLTSKLWISKAFNDTCYTNACKIIDDLEDEIGELVGLAWEESRPLRDYELSGALHKIGNSVLLLLKEAKSIKIS